MAYNLNKSNATIKAIRTGDARGRVNDGAGLYLRLFVKGGSHGWRFDYSLNGRRNTLSLGTYPDTGLSLARRKADEARKLVSAGVDPSEARKETREQFARLRDAEQRATAGLPPEDSFEAVAREWHSKNEPTWASSHSSKIIRRLEQDVFPWIGSRPVNAIRPMDLLALLKRVEERGAIETTHRIQQNCGQVFRYAVATARAESDPSRDLRGALTPWKPEHYPTVTEPREVGRLLRDIDAYQGGFITKCALALSPMLFVRPGELRRAEWSEINVDAAEWRIPAAKMKGRVMHIVPLATQAVNILIEFRRKLQHCKVMRHRCQVHAKAFGHSSVRVARISTATDKPGQVERCQAVTLLVLGDLCVRISGCITNDNGNLSQLCERRRTPPLRPEVNLIPPHRVDGMNNDGLQDAVLADVFGEFLEFGLGKFGARIVGVLK